MADRPAEVSEPGTALLATLPDLLLVLADVRQEAEQVRTALVAAEARSAAADVAVAELQEEIGSVAAALVASELRVQALEAELARAAEQAAAATAHAAEAEQRVTDWARRVYETEVRAEAAEGDARAAWARVVAAEDRLVSLQTTRSWRLTRPLRGAEAAGRTVQGVFRRSDRR